MSRFIFLCGLACTLTLQAMATVRLRIELVHKGKKLDLQTPGSDIEVRTLKFYLSGVTLQRGSTTVWREPASYHLVNAADTTSQTWLPGAPDSITFDSIAFNLGIDSVTNVAGVMGGALDPSNGMYWTWQSGYINMKLEGTSAISPAPRHAYTLHLGGYSGTNASLQKIVLPAQLTSQHITIRFDLDKFFNQVDLAGTHTIMSPGARAVELSKTAASCFSAR